MALKFGSPAWQRKYNPRAKRRAKKASRRSAKGRSRRRAIGARQIADRAANGNVVAALADLGAAPQMRPATPRGDAVLKLAASPAPISQGAVALGGSMTRTAITPYRRFGFKVL